MAGTEGEGALRNPWSHGTPSTDLVGGWSSAGPKEWSVANRSSAVIFNALYSPLAFLEPS